MSTPLLFCANCGAANQPRAVTCFACGQMLSAPPTADTTSSADGERIVKERYRVVRQVGTGGFGAVYLAQDTQTANRRVALKEIRLLGLSPQEMIEATDAFNREVSLLPGLRHPHLPRVYDHFTDPEHWYLLMQFIEGQTLESYVQTVPPARLPVEVVLDMGIQLADVLDYLHTRQPPIIFRDLKPANIMRTHSGHLYLIDFGIARLFKPGQLKDTIAFGSPGYAAPEQYGKAQTTPRSDLYSLGATLHFLLTGDDPANSPFAFAPLSLSSQPAVVSLQHLLAQLVELDVSKRPASAREVKRQLQEIATQLLQERLRVLYPSARPSQSSFIQPYVPPSASGNAGGQGGQQAQMQMGMYASNASQKRGQTRRRFVRMGAGALLTIAVTGGLMQLLGGLEQHPEPEIISAPAPSPTFGYGPIGYTYFTYHDPIGAVTSVTWSPDGNYIAMSDDSQIARVFRTESGVPVANSDTGSGALLAMAWSPDGNYIATAGVAVQIWKAPDFSSSLHMVYVSDGEVNAITWSSDSKYIASANNDGTVQVWDALTGTLLHTYRGHHAAVNTVAWSPDGSSIASGDAKGEVHIWKPLQVSDTLIIYKKHTGEVHTVTWSPWNYGYYVASGSADRTVRVWKALTGETITVYKGHSGAVLTAAWSPTDMRIASAGADMSVRIWNAPEGSDFFVYSRDGQAVISLAWSPDGKCIVSGTHGGTMQVWQAT
ncbi:MAG TPA: WD40 repeat domain-containing serine/threonine-protein kinase [Ktedonobacteraceae bacterium]|nr:WD40 repeat domain-containing serine/threonine-protein kinase [Ktedonobacteraceae bacterium]